MFDKIRSKKEGTCVKAFNVFIPEDSTEESFDKFIELAGEHDLELIGATLYKKGDYEWITFMLKGEVKKLYDFGLTQEWEYHNEKDEQEEPEED